MMNQQNDKEDPRISILIQQTGFVNDYDFSGRFSDISHPAILDPSSDFSNISDPISDFSDISDFSGLPSDFSEISGTTSYISDFFQHNV